MFKDYSNTFLDKFFQVDAIENSLPYFKEECFIDYENSNFSSKKEDINFFNEKNKPNNFLYPIISYESFSLILEEEEHLLESRNDFNPFNLDNFVENNIERKPYFKVLYPKKDYLLTKTDNISILIKQENEKTFLVKKKLSNEKTRKDNWDNIRRKIKGRFFNIFLIKYLNEILKSIGSNKYFEKFPQNFIKDIHQKRNKKIFAMTLGKVFMKEDLYINEKKIGFNNYLHNLKVIQSEGIKENKEFKKILNKTIRELNEEYINYDEFKIGEINRLKEKKMEDDYIKRYISLANNFIEFLFQ